LPTLRMNTEQLIADYPQPNAAKLAAVNRVANQVNQDQMQAQRQQSRGEAAAAVIAHDSQSAGDADEPSPMKQSGNVATPGAALRGSLGVDPNAVPRPIADDSKRPARIVEELAMAKVTRSVYSERQLQQVMDDFWFNHFNVYAAKGEDRYYLTAYERDVIAPHALGKFKELLLGTAKSPAML